MVELKRTLQSISKPQSVSRGDFHGSTPDFIQATDLAGKPTMMVDWDGTIVRRAGIGIVIKAAREEIRAPLSQFALG
jgi:hypothetical protein